MHGLRRAADSLTFWPLLRTDSQKRVYDPVIQSVSGLASIQADEDDRPRMMRLIIPDKVTALTSAQAIAAALVKKYKTGKGSYVELAMLDATLNFSWGEGMARYGFVDDPDSSESVDPDENPHEYIRDMVFRTSDGFITAGAVQQKEWEGLCAGENPSNHHHNAIPGNFLVDEWGIDFL